MEKYNFVFDEKLKYTNFGMKPKKRVESETKTN